MNEQLMDDFEIKHLFSRLETHIIDDRDMLNFISNLKNQNPIKTSIKHLDDAIEYLRESQRQKMLAESSLRCLFDKELKLCSREKLPSYEEFKKMNEKND